MSLLTIIQDVAKTISLSPPNAVISSNDELVRTLLALANEEGKAHARRFAWQRLTKEGSFTTVADETQSTIAAATGAGSSDFGLILPDTMYNRTSKWKVYGPRNPQQWQALKSSGLNAATRSHFRLRGDSILFYPDPTAGESVYFEYISKNWCKSAADAEQSSWAADDDTALIDEEIHKLGIKWRFLRSKGLSYGEEFNEYEYAIHKIASHDGASEILDLNAIDEGLELVTPDSNWEID